MLIALQGAWADTPAPNSAGDPWREAWRGRPDSHAPIGVMGDHMHEAGHWMLSYRYMRMRMKGNRDGNHDLSIDEVFALPVNYAAVPTDMDMEMHMFGVMYAPTDWLTAVLLIVDGVDGGDLGCEVPPLEFSQQNLSALCLKIPHPPNDADRITILRP